MKHIVKAPVTPEVSIQERKGRALARAAAAEGFVLLKNAGFEIVSEEWINRYDAFYEAAYQNWHDHIEELVK